MFYVKEKQLHSPATSLGTAFQLPFNVNVQRATEKGPKTENIQRVTVPC